MAKLSNKNDVVKWKYMPRIKFRKQLQSKFLTGTQKELGLSWPQLAKILRVHPRSLSDWRREKYTIPEKVFKRCIELTKNKVEIPPYKVLQDFWSIEKAARKGGLVVAKKYGGPGTPEGRRKGGIASQQRRRLHPELFQHCNLRKNILIPRDTLDLAEFFGIVLGDGGINNDYQVVITLNKENDREYVYFIRSLIKKLFGLTPAIYRYRSPKCKKVVGVTTSSSALIEFLLSKGLKKGGKVRQQVGVPSWIENKIELSRSCLKGLVDTDGGVYCHLHKSHGYQHFNIGLAFSNRSLPLLNFVKNTLSNFGFNPKVNSEGCNICLYQESEVLRYSKEIGFSNPYHLDRIKIFINKKLRKGARAV